MSRVLPQIGYISGLQDHILSRNKSGTTERICIQFDMWSIAFEASPYAW